MNCNLIKINPNNLYISNPSEIYMKNLVEGTEVPIDKIRNCEEYLIITKDIIGDNGSSLPIGYVGLTKRKGQEVVLDIPDRETVSKIGDGKYEITRLNRTTGDVIIHDSQIEKIIKVDRIKPLA